MTTRLLNGYRTNNFGMDSSPKSNHKFSEDSIQNLLNEIAADLNHLHEKYPMLKETPRERTGNISSPKKVKLSASASANTNIDVKTKRKSKKFKNKSMGHLVPVAINVERDAYLSQLLNLYQTRCMVANKNRKIFTISNGYDALRDALLQRGWVEKVHPTAIAKYSMFSYKQLLQCAERGNEYERTLMSKIVEKYPAYFVWQVRTREMVFPEAAPYRNRIRSRRRLRFTSKIGLTNCAEMETWYRRDNDTILNYPRIHKLHQDYKEWNYFLKDYRQTQCRSLLTYILNNVKNASNLYDNINGTVPSTTLDFALISLKEEIRQFERLHDDFKSELDENDWEVFLNYSNKIIHYKMKLKMNSRELFERIRIAKMLFKQLLKKKPNLRWDGYHNLWIVKPGNSSRGIGIYVLQDLESIYEFTKKDLVLNYIVQKYIERPLIIYGSKFDIRMYMLLTINDKCLSVWLYHDCYLRFSTQEFSLTDLREEVHLTNNSVQKRYKIDERRDERLPTQNMWSLHQFKSYLRSIEVNGSDSIWENRVFPGFVKNLTGIVNTSVEDIEFVNNSFELYGLLVYALASDFHFDENSAPDLLTSTMVTKIFAQV
ncbi:tubulin glycylase 3B-like [Teleopsis dalmanni]|uniref:tubulin glycylase 3B-like n=1 Tax=Teleopsis dalmanni TaxID=139649 RepID=UPI0018CE171E|nr:tubulin glycylase 3B-like [Teleopsis dalmanni]